MARKIKSIVLGIVVLVTIATIFMCVTGIYQNRKLFNAIDNNDVVATQKALKYGAWVNARKHLNITPIVEIVTSNPTPLEYACKIGNQEIVQLLLENGAKINKGNKQTHSTPLLYALHGTKSNRFSLAMYLIENGADIYNADQAKRLGEDLLYISSEDSENIVQEGFLLFQYLMEKDVPIGFSIGTESLLTFSARYNNYNAVRYLVDEGYFNVNEYDRAQNTALIIATKFENLEMVELLLELGADVSLVDANGNTALDYAIKLNNTPIATLLSGE